MDRLHEAAFQALLRGSDDLILVIDRQGRILECGALAQQCLAPDEGPLQNSSVLDRLSNDSGRALLAFLDALGTDGAITLEQTQTRASGAADVRRIRYAVHAIPGTGSSRLFVLIGRQTVEPAPVADVSELVATDPLTGLANRVGLAAGLARLWAACEEDPTRPLAWVLVADLDHFKSVNDTCGHAAGDAMLIAVASVLLNSVRAGDFVARMGGDEFVLAGPADGLSDIQRIAERIVEAVRTLRLNPAGVAGSIQVTISVGGVLVTPGPGVRERDAIAAADKAMYRAKSGGRDRAEVELDPSA